MSERNSQQFNFQAIPEITVTLQDAFSLEINQIYTTQHFAVNERPHDVDGPRRGPTFSQRAHSA